MACGGPVSNLDDGLGNQTDPKNPDEVVKPTVKKEARQLFKMAVSAYKNGQKQQAIEHLKEVLNEQPDLGPAYYNIGFIYESQDNLDEARGWYQKSAEEGKNFGDGLVRSAYLMEKNGQKEAGRGMIQKALQEEKLNAGAYLNLAQEARKRRDFASAIKYVRTALKSNSQNPQAYEVLARVYYDMNKPELVILVCQTGLHIDENYSELNNILGLVHLKADNVISAISSFEDAIKSNPNHLSSLINLGALTFGYRDYESAYRYFSKAEKVAPDNLKVILSKAVAARALGRHKEAEKGYQQVLVHQPNHSGAHYNLGVLYQEYTQNLEGALKEYQMVLRHENRDGKLRKDVTQRIKASRIQIQNMQELKEELKREKERERREAAKKAAAQKAATDKKSTPKGEKPKKAPGA